MKIYIAGSWEDRDQIKEIMNALISKGHSITEDWTTHVNPGYGQVYAHKDIAGIEKCYVFIMYLSGTKTFGKAFEMGYAFAKGKCIIAFGDREYATSVFFKFKKIKFVDNIDELVEHINLMAEYMW